MKDFECKFLCKFLCEQCGLLVQIKDVEQLFDIVETQVCAENRMLFCQECIRNEL